MLEQFINTVAGLFGVGFAGVLKAVLLLALAFIFANLVQEGVEKGLSKVSFFRGRADTGEILELAGRLAYLSVLLLFIPGICSALGASSIADPILDMLKKLWAFLPNLIGAGILLVVGCRVAKLVRQLLSPCIQKFIPKLFMEKLDIDADGVKRTAEAVAYIMYIAVLVPVFIATLQVLDLSSLTRPAVNMLQSMLGFIPNLLAFVFIFGIGLALSRLVGRFVETALFAAGVDDKLQKLAGYEDRVPAGRIAGRFAAVLTVVFFSVEALHSLRLTVLSSVGRAVIRYLPNVVAAIAILALAWLLANLAVKALPVSCGKGNGALMKSVIYVLAGFMALSQLSIAPYIVNTAFIILCLGIAVAFALAVGLGAKDAVRSYLEHRMGSCRCKEKEEKGVKEE